MNKVDLVLVEDSPELAELVVHALEMVSPQPTVASFSSARSALDFLLETANAAEPSTPRLVLLDLNLPGMSGHDLLSELRSDPKTAFIPVVMFSSSSSNADVCRSYALGANGYLVKPVNAREFALAVVEAAGYWLGRNIPCPATA